MNTLSITDINPARVAKAIDAALHPRAMDTGTTRPTCEPPAREPRNLRREITDDGLCVLTFDRPDSAANIFDAATLDELDDQLAFIESRRDLKGVVLTSAKPAIFIAGADVHALHTIISTPTSDLRERLGAMVTRGQQIFSRLAALPVPTVAAIHGACLGGGFELCLACDYRIASPDNATKLGLPETQLGILPAWGGSTRLPRLIGLPKALDLILGGKSVPAKHALKLGIIDEVAPRESLFAAARRKISALNGRVPSRPRHARGLASAARWFAPLIHFRVRNQLLRKTRGHYHSVLAALDVVTRGIVRPFARSLELERDAFVELATGRNAQNLIGLFLLQERAKKLGFTAPPEVVAQRHHVANVAVIGAGVMGAGIAQCLSSRGVRVILKDINTAAVARGMASITKLYNDAVKRRLMTPLEARRGLDRIAPATGDVSLAHVDAVIEAAVEKLDLKQQLFRKLATQVGSSSLLLTNTSALSVAQIAEGTGAAERVAGLHFFNPVHRMQLVEVVVGTQTSAETTLRAVRFAQQLGKLPAVVKDRPGFLVNRILMPYLIEAGHLFEEGAGIAEIDEAMLDFGMPMGPLRLIDEVGLDVALHVAGTLGSAFGERLASPPILKRLLDAGCLGKKSGRGFYIHEGKNAHPNPDAAAMRTTQKPAALDHASLQDRMVFAIVNEAARCLEEGIVATADDVDFGMVLGTGFAPFRGGPLRYADQRGLGEMVVAMDDLANSGLKRFEPCARLRSLARMNGHFHAPHAAPATANAVHS